MEKVVKVQSVAPDVAARETFRGPMHVGQGYPLRPGIVRVVEVWPASVGVSEQHGGAHAIGQRDGSEERAVSRRYRNSDRNSLSIEVSEERGLGRNVTLPPD